MFQYDINARLLFRLLVIASFVAWAYFEMTKMFNETDRATYNHLKKFPRMSLSNKIEGAEVVQIAPYLDYKGRAINHIDDDVNVVLIMDSDTIGMSIVAHDCNGPEFILLEEFIKVGSKLRKDSGSNELTVGNEFHVNGVISIGNQVFSMDCNN